MAIVYHIDKNKGIAYVLWEGIIRADEFIEHVRRLTADPDWQSSVRFQIGDLRHAIGDMTIDDDVLEEVGTYFGQYVSKMAMIRAAIVTSLEVERTNFFAGFMSHYDSARARVFHGMKEAVEWLGVDAAETEAVFKKLHSVAAAK